MKTYVTEYYFQYAPTGCQSLIESMQIIKNPYKKCCEVWELVKNITQQVKVISENPELVADCESFSTNLYDSYHYVISSREKLAVCDVTNLPYMDIN